MIVEDKVVLGADIFLQLLLHPAIAPNSRPLFIERVGVICGETHFECLAVINHFPMLYDMQFRGVECAVTVNEGFDVLADGIDDERIAFVAADRLSIPGRFRIF
jgi:hypothetical protein